MELFNKKYVHCMWDDSLDGKPGFFSDNVNTLYSYVNNNCRAMNDTIKPTNKLDYPFYTSDNTPYRFVYYDPNYLYKLDFSNGTTVEVCISKSKNTWIPVKDLDDLDDPTGIYRVVLKEGDPEDLVTYEELAQWLTKGNGLVMDKTICKVSTVIDLNTNPLDAEVSRDYLIRRYGEKEWHKPTKKYVYNK